MKPEQFIRDFGEKKAREVVEGAPKNAQRYFLGKYLKQGEWTWWWSGYLGKWLQFEKHVYGDSKFEIAINLSDLKRLVESVDLVKKLGGRSGAIREYFEYVHSGKSELDIRPNELARAIADYESIYRGGDE
ncbi:hypothetical protein OHW04_02155 [Acinetobacter baumannii]|nr:hypothetical protein [Acinetobacter baumannii]